MGEQYYQLILEKYRNRERDFDGLFETILAIGDEIGLKRALGYLEKCVIEKRSAWLDDGLADITTIGRQVGKVSSESAE